MAHSKNEIRVGILISGSGSNMVALVKAMQDGGFAKPAVVIANNATAKGLEKANDLGVPSVLIDSKDYKNDRTGFETALHNALSSAKVDIICLAGFMKVLSGEFIAKWPDRILNIHPSLLPKYKGLNTHQRALDAGDKTSGCSVHIVTANLDDGPILGQEQVEILPDDTAETLAQRILVKEHCLYPRTLRNFVKTMA